MTNTVPSLLYKYRHFDERTIELLCADTVYYADPSTFNDPLDTKPCVDADCDVATMERGGRANSDSRISGTLGA